MALSTEQVLRILYPGCVEGRSRRFTQDTPILPDVWMQYGADPDQPCELLLTPHREVTAARLAHELVERLKLESRRQSRRAGARAGSVPVGFNDSHVYAKLSLKQLIRDALPLSAWWREELGRAPIRATSLARLATSADLVDLLLEPGRQDETAEFPENALNFIRIVGAMGLGQAIPEDRARLKDYLKRVVAKARELLVGVDARGLGTPAPLYSVFKNRVATAAISRSCQCVKADAAARLFEISCRDIRFAVLDSGIDASHPAFQKRTPQSSTRKRKSARPSAGLSRVVKTLDFTMLKELMTTDIDAGDDENKTRRRLKLKKKEGEAISRDIRQRLADGRPLDWSVLEPALEVSHGPRYVRDSRPRNEHGTHVAGILGADWKEHQSGSGKDEPLIGMCPDIEIYDLRVISEDGTGDEFCILGALQYVRYLNQSKGRTVIHGVNLSLSIPHLASSYACGQTPICEEVNRLVNNGVVVVTAAGNGGYAGTGVAGATDYRDISITDPGNADLAITVGATHRFQPHRYGVSYFSSRGPTGDGRLKPDLVAPGEQILSTVPGAGSVVLDGTSMAAPHVSGAAALLMARYRELIGQPQRIKEIICGTATDLGRARDFQGSGVLDVLRALQSI